MLFVSGQSLNYGRTSGLSTNSTNNRTFHLLTNMSSKRALEALETLQLAVNLNVTRPPADPFLFAPAFANTAQTRMMALSSAIMAASFAEGDRAGASGICRACLDALEKTHRAGWWFLSGLLPEFIPVPAGDPPNISDSVRLQQFERYGFPSGEVGEMNDARTEEMARISGSAATTGVANPAWHYPQVLLDFISTHYQILQAHQGLATGGSRQVAIAAVNTALESGEDMIARIRGVYIAASDDGDRTPQLKRIGLQPRRLPGEAGNGIVPDAPANATLDAVAKTLSIPVLPANANSIRAYRQKVAVGATPAGPVELAGVSISTTVSYTQSGPMEAGVGYEVWLVGYDGTDEGSPGTRLAVMG